MKVQPTNSDLRRVDQFQDWINRLDRIRDEMRGAGVTIAADHLDNVAADLSYDQAEILEMTGPLVVWKR